MKYLIGQPDTCQIFIALGIGANRSRYAQNQVTANYSIKTIRILSLMPICTAENP